MQLPLDPYIWKARLRPALLVILPPALALAAWFPEKFVGWELLIGVLGFCGATALLEHLAAMLDERSRPSSFGSGKASRRRERYATATPTWIHTPSRVTTPRSALL